MLVTRLFILICILAGALAPILYHGGSFFLNYPFHRWVNRSLMVSAIIVLIAYRKQMGFFRWKDLGFYWTRNTARHVRWSTQIGFLSIVSIVALEWLFRGRVGIFPSTPHFLPKALFTAITVSILEETLFRGILQRYWMQRLGHWGGTILASFFFSLVHFIKVPSDYFPHPVSFFSGWEAIGRALLPFTHFEDLWTRAVALALVGGCLGIIYRRSNGNLWGCIVLHAVWIFLQKIFMNISHVASGTPPFWFSDDILSGGIAILTLIFLLVWLCLYYPKLERYG